MGRFDEGISKLQSQQDSAAAPAGLQQQAAGQEAEGNRFASGLGKLQSWTPEDHVANAQSWFTGANNDELANGWGTEFVEEFNSGWNTALEQGNAQDYFSNGTGVVLWNHTTSNGESFAFGDVVENGRKTGNVYEQFDRDTANLMLLPWVADGKEQARLFDDPENARAEVDRFIRGKQVENDANMDEALGAMEFAAETKETQEGLQEGASDEWLAGGGGAVGGAITGGGAGAALGSIIPGAGTLAGGAVGGAIGFVAGGIGGLLNKDEISEAAARSYEIAELSFEENNFAAGAATALKEGAGFSMKLTSPLQNLTRGLTDWSKGDVGDGVSERYRLDEKGESTVGLGYKVADWTALVGDSLMQFANPLNRAIFSAQMSGVIGGEVAQLALTGGEMFDPREGNFDNIFVDDEGNFDPVSASAGIGKIAIDAVQLAGWRGLARQTGAQRAAVASGGRITEVAGHRFILNEAGDLVSSKKTMALLAPSEQIASISAARAARVSAMKNNRAVTADDFYRAANDLATGSNFLRAAVVNGFGEAYEEGLQAVLEPVALDGDLDFNTVASGFFYGLASGIGMSSGAMLGRPNQDQKLMAQAYVVETIRRGEEPDRAQFESEWAAMSDSEKRVRATRTPGDAAMLRGALDRIAADQAATLVATEVDAAKAIDARRTAVEKELKSASGRTDAFTVFGAILDAGRVSETGALLGDTAPAEAVEASAVTIHRLLENRLKGFGIQVDFLTRRVAELEAADPTDPRLNEVREQLATAELGRALGENLVADVEAIVSAIYGEGTDELQARDLTRQLNSLLRGIFERKVTLNLPEGATATDEQIRDAAAQFVTLLQSREPKLDTGSYLALLPRASWQLTAERSDNFLQVNTDVLQAINGDFDGDKLRAENQLVLTAERYAQARAGQFFGGTGAELDVAVRNFDEKLTAAVASGLAAEPGQLKDEAEATLANITTAISGRYGPLMSPAALARVLEEFRVAVVAGSEEARVTLLNALAREAGGAITDLGRAALHNEWLWASKVVRANFEAFQTTFRKLRAQDTGPSETVDTVDLDTEGVNRRKDQAVTDAQTLALFAIGNTQFRKYQKIHYTVFNASVLSAENTEQSDLYAMAQMYEELGRGVTRSELARVGTDDSVAGRALVMLSRIVDSALADPDLAGQFNPAAAMSVFANVKVKDVWFADGEPVTDGQEMSLGQVLLKRALDADRAEHARTFDVDEKLQAKHARLRALTVPNSVAGTVNAERAYLEIFKAVPFGDSLGGTTGALAAHTTPEQWLRNYISLDETGRQQMERLFKNVPEYLDRKETSNLPYSWHEASRREVSPYRSMMDALLAVGRASLTFDPAKPAAEAFGGDMAEVSKRAATDFRTGHDMLRAALADFRTITNRRSKTRLDGAALAQQMLQANPSVGRQVLDLIPDAAANAVYEYRDGQLYVAPWVYEMFAIEDSNEALFFYWKNLTLAQWNSTQVEGRRYDRLNSRMQRLLHRLASEPGQPMLETVLRKMDSSRNLDEFFVWLNATPGIRGQEAVYLPFHDDVVDFEADAGGGWVNIKAGSDLRTAIATMRRGAKQLRDTMAFRTEKAATDRQLLDGIKRAHSGDPTATPMDQENLRKLAKAVSVSRELPRGFAPTAMLALTQGAMRGFDAQSHDKGRTATSYGPMGEFQALMDAFAFVPGLERVMETLTAHSISSLRTNVGDIAKHSGVAMDANGRQIEWAPLSVEQAIEMLDDSRTAPLAHALLTPAALDITPSGMSERLLMEASLKDLLDDDHYKDLFRDSGDKQIDAALRYLSLVDAKARAEGGSFDAIRAANDLAIARTSGLGRPATEDDLARLRNQAYLELAQVLKLVGRVQASPDMREAGTLAQLREAALVDLRQQRMSRALPSFTDSSTGQVMEEWVDGVLGQLEGERVTLLQSLTELYSGDELGRHTEMLNAQYERNEQRVRGMLEDNIAAAIMSRFQVTGDPIVDRAAHAQIVEYVRSMASFPARAPEAAQAWGKLVGQLNAGSDPDLTAAEWDTLSRAAMGVTLVDQTLRVASHVTLPPFPKGDPAISEARFYKYFDPDFSFLVTDLLAEDSPLTRAAVWLHTIAEQPRTTLPIDTMTRTLRRTVLNRSQLGAWTPGLMSQIVEAHTRIDSAAAGQAIAAAGNGPKRWAAIAAATRRTGAVPGPELLTTVTFPGSLLAEDASRFNEIPVQPTGAAEPSMMPVAMLDNRFFASIKLNGVDIGLDANLGFEWTGADEANPYRYVALERLRPVVERFASANGINLADVQLEVEFFHPDSQPAGVWNNAFFEGMSHTLLPDGAESLVATLWSDNGGMISTDTQRPLDAGKKGLRAIQPFLRLDADSMAEADALWSRDRDFAAMLRRKTELVMGYDDGNGALDPSYYNAVYKHMKLAHILVMPDGQTLAAEQVLALAAAEGRASQTLAEAKLVRLSPDVLRTMLGETGDQGVTRFFDDEFLLNPDLVAPYQGIPAAAVERFAGGWLAEAGTVGDTSLANIGQQRALTVRTILTDAERNTRQDRIVYLNNRSADVRAARHQRLDKADVREGYLAALRLAQGSIATEKATFDFGATNSGFIAPRNLLEADHSGRLLEAMKGITDPNRFERGWQVVDEGGPDYPGGVLTLESLNTDRPAEHHVVKDDLAVVRLDSFTRPEQDPNEVQDRVEKALRYLANSGATVALGSGDGSGDLRFEASQYLLSLGYAPVEGSKHLYAPVEFVFESQNERAYGSTLAETKAISPAYNAVTFLAIDPVGTDENVAILNPASAKLRDRKVVNNLVPTAWEYNLPIEDNTDSGLYAKTLRHLRTMLDPTNTEARDALVKMAGPDPERVMGIGQALDRLHAKISNRSSLVPEVGDVLEVGDIIPFVHPDGKVLLYRHGFKLPRREELAERLATDGMNIALATSETEPAATANSGTVRSVANKAGYARAIELDMPLQPYGDKIQLEWNGMKYVVAPPPEGFTMPPVFRNGTVVDLVSDVASADSKEAYEGRVFGYRNALTFFQFDFTDDLVRFFFPGESTSDPQTRVLTVDLLSRLAAQDQFRIPFSDANAIAKANVAVADLLGEFAAAESERSGVAPDWLDRLQASNDPSAQIARAMVTYLLTPGANLGNVLRSGGFSHPRANDPNVTTRQVPGLFAELLDNGTDSALHAELIRRFDAQLLRGPNGEGFRLRPDWSVEMFDGSGDAVRGYLQFGEAHSSGDNPLLDGQAFDINEPAAVSAHNTMAANLSVGATTAHLPLRKARAFAKSFGRGGKVSKLGTDGDSVWQMLTALPSERDPSLAGWRRETPAETLRRAAAREELVGFYQPLSTENWSEDEVAAYQRAAIGVLDELNLYGKQRAMVDTWVRMHLGRPHGVDDNGAELGVMSHSDVMETVAEIRRNVRTGLLPTAKANVPLIDVNHLTTIYLANMNRDDGWAPIEPGTKARMTSWDAWVETAFGTAFDPDARFDQMFLLAVDGLMHGYQGATTSTRYLPVSTDILRQKLLMDEKTNQMLVSISADENLLATDPTLFGASSAELEDIIAGQRIYAPGRDGADPSSAKGRAALHREKWRREVEAPRQAGKTMRGVRGPGQTFLGHTTTTSAFWRSMINLRAGNTLFNLSLAVVAPFEAFYRRTINTFANLLTGDATGAAGQAQAKLVERFGGQLTYSSEQLVELNKLVDALSTLPDFKAMIYRELMFQYPTMPGIGRVEKVLERYAKFGAKMQDPAWGMLPKDLARIYVETVMRKISQSPTGENLYSVERLLASLPRDPQWVQKQDLDAHNMAIAAISQVRSLKPNVLSLGFRGIVEPLSENPKFVANSAGNMLKVLTLFQNFWANFGTTITGLQGAVDFAGFWFDGREKKLTLRAQRALRGDQGPITDPEFFDMSEALESMDLADSFVRGGVTHSALFALGMFAGGLGLSGEDEEMKFRRRQAELQGVPVLHDPRDLEADFRNRDAIFLDWLPFGMDSWFKVNPEDPDSRAMAQMNWITRTFLSPVIGFERFYETGDFTEVIHGFKDAIGAHPIVNQQLWNSATDTAADLHAQANDAAEKGDMVGAGHMLMTAVGVLEGMLVENSMVNMIYVGRDEWDRDPYVLPLKDSEGTLQRDIEGEVRPNDTALRPFVNDDGAIQQGYLGRSAAGADARVLTENRATAAFVAALFSGGLGDSDYWRYNMPIKTRTIDKPDVSQEEAEALVKAAMAFQMSMVKTESGMNVTPEEIMPAVRNQLYQMGDKTGQFFTDDQVWEAARAMAASMGTAHMSILDSAGREHLTDEGAKALFRGLHKGAITLDSPAMRGVYITYEMREKIAAEWSTELVQEGIDLGLDETKARSRMKRIMGGPLNDPEVPGLGDLLFSNQISYEDSETYGQLNTSYVMGPDGRPWATGFTRDGLLGAIGLKPLKSMIDPIDGVTGRDARGNTVDLVNGMNTGLRGLVPFDDSRYIPTDQEIGEAIEKAIADAAKAQYTPFTPFDKSGGSGSGYGWRNFGGYGGSGGGGGAYFTKMYSMPNSIAPYANSISAINSSNPYIRRAFIRRERVWAERGRLKQWQ